MPAASVAAAASAGPRGRELLAALADFAGAPLRVTAVAQGRATGGAPAPAAGAAAGPVVAPAALPRAAAGALAEPGAVLDRSTPLPSAVPGEVRPPVIAAPPPPAAPLPPDSAASLPDLARAVQAQIRGRSFVEGTTRIELAPQGLGDLEIELSPGEAGRLRVVLRADNPMVLAALRGDRETLLGALRDGGAQVPDSGLSFEDFGARQGAGRQPQAPQTGTGARAPAGPETPDPVEPPHRLGPGRLDILT
jgi:hypothetical protein